MILPYYEPLGGYRDLRRGYYILTSVVGNECQPPLLIVIQFLYVEEDWKPSLSRKVGFSTYKHSIQIQNIYEVKTFYNSTLVSF